MKQLLYISITLLGMQNGFSQQPLFQSKAYTIYPDKVTQGNMQATALSATEIISNYKSPANQLQPTMLSFKFSINGKDNEMQPGINHQLNVLPGVIETPVILFGKQLKDTTGDSETYLQPDSKLQIRVDMRTVLSDFKSKGFYTTFKGDKIYPEDFKGLYVAGSALPMTWDFDNLHTRKELELTDSDGDGIYETTLLLNAQKDEKQTEASWKLSTDISAFPQYNSDQPIINAIYNMSLEEMIKAVEPDNTFRTGKEWAGVWTRDISYSIILSMAYLQPDVAKNSLLRKVNAKKRIIQDTGTGGAYPCSTDRIVWSVAAWEIYKATGDENWLQQASEIIKNTIEDDMQVAYNVGTGLVKGESSFLDWREQTYPKWMEPADIYESENLGTNAVHYQANVVLSQMLDLLNNPLAARRYKTNAAKIEAAINQHLWMADKGFYGQYIYGRNYKSLSQGSEALGEALCVLFGIASPTQADMVISHTPMLDYGIPCIYPQIPDIPPYHNDAVWPFVQSYWALASAKAGNEKSVMESLAAIYRPAALFLTNKENFVAGNGDFAGTVINSSNMLWSLSGNLAMVHKLLFGIEFQHDKLVFHPFVPMVLKGKHSLTNFKYRKAFLDISIEGFGNKIQNFLLDGKMFKNYEVPENLTGQHTVKIVLANNIIKNDTMNKIPNLVSPATPVLTPTTKGFAWQKVTGAKYYMILKNNELISNSEPIRFVTASKEPASYQVYAVDELDNHSFASEPFVISDSTSEMIVEAEQANLAATLNYKGFSGSGFVEISKVVNKTITIPVSINTPGIYAIDFRYANGNGPVNTENKCALRSLYINNVKKGTIVLPQRGKDEWSNWGFTNKIQLKLAKGNYNITLAFDEYDDNMNGVINQAMVDYMRVVRL